MPQANKNYKIMSCFFMSWDKEKQDANAITDCEYKGTDKNGDYVFSNIDDDRDFATIAKKAWESAPWAEKGEIYPF